MNSSILQSLWRLSSPNVRRIRLNMTDKGYVIKVVKTRHTPVLNWVQRNYATINVTNRKTTLFEEAFSKLQSDFTHLGYVSAINFKNLLQSLEDGRSLTSEQSIFLLESCSPDLMPSQSPETRMELFKKLWQHLKNNDDLKKEHYVSYIKVHADNAVALGDFRQFVEEKNLAEVPEIYEKLIQYACQLGDIKRATEILAEMKAKGFALTENVFNALIMGHSENKDLKNALVVLETMKAARIEPSPSTFTQLIGAYIKSNEIGKAAEILLQHSGNFNANQLIYVIKILAETKQIENKMFMELLINEFPTEFLICREVPSPIRNFCTELIHTGRLKEACDIINVLPCPKFNENQDRDTYGYVFIQDLFRGKVESEKIIEIVNNLVESNKNPRALHVACDSAMHRNPDLAYPYLKSLSEKEALRPHYFWPIFLHKFRNNGENGIINVMKMMSELKVDCDYETLLTYVFPKLSITLGNTQQSIKILESCGIKTSLFLSPLIAYLITQQRLEEVIQIAQLYTSKFETKNFVQPLSQLALHIRTTKRFEKYGKAIHTLHLKAKDSKFDFVGQILIKITTQNKLQNDVITLERIISTLNRLGIKISPAAAEMLNVHLVNIKAKDTNIPDIRHMLTTMTNRNLNLMLSENGRSNVLHPRDMNYEQLECHLIELKAKGMNTRGVLRRLLQICVKENRLDRALEVKRKCDIAKLELSPGMMASIFEMHIKLGDYLAALSSLQDLEKSFPGFLLDEHKLLDFATLLVQNNELEKAKQILSDRAASKKVIGGDYVVKNVWNLLTSVARLAAQQPNLPSDTNLTKEMFSFLCKFGYCNADNTVLGPIIREHILRKDIRSAMAEFKKLAEKYRRTPLQFELCSLLVRLSNEERFEDFNISKDESKELLQQLTTIVSNIHGQVNMNSSLLLAVAESGTENQLRKLLINPEFRLNHEMLNQNCEHLNKEGGIYTLLRLAKACRGLGHIIKEDDVYNMLLEKFISDNNCSASLELFEKLEADDELKMSQKFLNNLINLLKVNKVKIPNSLALRAQVL